ncbi:hypothetical protein KSP40_PGU011503 [Platanthera guangdongensis]|uniref:Beta-1,3-glucanase n=1 Tax=Platanthera guangdongensis TaxID=2320717 RepID=A0ABR2M8I1_9ASPA
MSGLILKNKLLKPGPDQPVQPAGPPTGPPAGPVKGENPIWQRTAQEPVNRAGGPGSLGVNYGMQANNLPSPSQVIALCKSRNIHKLRIYGTNPDVLAALRNSGISLIMDANEQDLQQLATNPTFAGAWVQANVVPYAGSVNFQYIVMGNEQIPGNSAGYILPAIYNVAGSLQGAGLSIPVTTAVSIGAIGTTFPPSQGAFSNQALQYLGPIVSLLASRKTPLLVNIYPYFSYMENPTTISLDYALFRAKGTVVQDGNLGYWNLFDAMVDTVRSALDRIGGGGVGIVVSESGWPSAGGPSVATIDNAKTYMNNLVGHVYNKAGTPKMPDGTWTSTYFPCLTRI